MTQFFSIQDDKVVINKLLLSFLEGDIVHSGTIHSTGPVTIQNDLNVNGSLIVDTLKVRNLISDTIPKAEPVIIDTGWKFESEEEVNGKGLSWYWDGGDIKLIYRKGYRLWTNSHIDLDATKSYKINNVEVLSLTQLGPQVTKSNLKKVGKLKSLEVVGDAVLGEFAVFSSTFNRLGINTLEPNASLSIVENNVELIFGSPSANLAVVGTHTNSDLSFVTDNTSRITIKNNGETVFGTTTSPTNVTIHGTLEVTSIVTDTRVDRSTSLEFKATRETGLEDKGLIWTGFGETRKLVIKSNPDRIYSTESVDLAEGRSFYIDNVEILSKNYLGATVTSSNLTKLGTLDSLSVNGPVEFNSDVTLNESIRVIQDNNSIVIKPSSINVEQRLSIGISYEEAVYVDSQEITIGNKNNSLRPVKLFGPVSIGIANPDSSLGLSVKGDVSFNNKKFIKGLRSPTQGNFLIGDICWNEEPKEGSFIGWVCVAGGNPGSWLPFGSIGSK